MDEYIHTVPNGKGIVKIRFVILLPSESYLRLIFLILINRRGRQAETQTVAVYIFFFNTIGTALQSCRVKIAPYV